jgi:predicted dehydrogenase
MSAQPHLERAPRARLGFLGLGWIGRKRLDALSSAAHVEIAALCDSDERKLQSAADMYPEAQLAAGLDDLVARDLDGVVIATPNSMHAEQATACLAAGKAVFCQKPLAVDLENTERVVAAARSADRLLGIDYCYRHVQGMSELRRRIAAGALGHIQFIDLKFYNAYGPDKSWCYERRMSGGGCLLDLGIHLVDLALWLQGARGMTLVSRRLFSKGRPLDAYPSTIEDFACAEFRCDNEAVVRIACCWNADAGADAQIGFELFGSAGGAAWRNVGGSFYDFELHAFRGTSRERLGTYPDDWGVRGLRDWAWRLTQSASFDAEAWDIVAGARLIESVYRQ